jgi:hypothetical protein
MPPLAPAPTLALPERDPVSASAVRETAVAIYTPRDAEPGCFDFLKKKAALLQSEARVGSALAERRGAPSEPVGRVPVTLADRRGASGSSDDHVRARSGRSGSCAPAARGPVARAEFSPPAPGAARQGSATKSSSVDPLARSEEDSRVVGSLLGLLDARGAQSKALGLLSRATRAQRVWIVGYSWDREDMTDAVINAFQRGCSVRVLLDCSMTIKGKTRDQLSSAQRMRAAGVDLRLGDGTALSPVYSLVQRKVFGNLRGIVHAKVVSVGDETLVGSANWTTSSRCNVEVVAHLSFPQAMLEELLAKAWEEAEPLSDAMLREAQREGAGDRRR